MTARIDAPGTRLYPLLAGMTAVALSGCAAHRPPPAMPASVAAAPAAEATASPDAAMATAAVAASAPREPLRLLYNWSLQDRDARFSGRAAARVEPPYHARLDLFGPRGEGYLSAAVVGSDVRVPERLQAQAALVPAPALLWTALGVLRPPEDARLTSARRSADGTRLEYARGDQRWRFDVVGARVRHAELDAEGKRYTVDLKGDGPLGLPRQAVYRDYAEFRELTLTLDQAHEAQPFPPDTWTPGGR